MCFLNYHSLIVALSPLEFEFAYYTQAYYTPIMLLAVDGQSLYPCTLGHFHSEQLTLNRKERGTSILYTWKTVQPVQAWKNLC